MNNIVDNIISSSKDLSEEDLNSVVFQLIKGLTLENSAKLVENLESHFQVSVNNSMTSGNNASSDESNGSSGNNSKPKVHKIIIKAADAAKKVKLIMILRKLKSGMSLSDAKELATNGGEFLNDLDDSELKKCKEALDGMDYTVESS